MRILTIFTLAMLSLACTPNETRVEAPQGATTANKPAGKAAPAPTRPTVVQIEDKPRVERFNSLLMLASEDVPERDGIRDPFRYTRAIVTTELDGLRYYFYQPGNIRSIVGFTFLNDGSPRINPPGLTRNGPRREYAFLFADRARENIHLAINDDVKLSGRFSHDNMFRELHFFPRRQLPSLKVDHGKGLIRVTLPTGEPVVFDSETKEITSGVLQESPIDFNTSRHLRKNPRVTYRGDYLAITVAQRGEAPRRAKVWGQPKTAEVHYPSRYDKPCTISPARIWDQRPKPGDSDPKLTMLHDTDEELFAVIEKHCNWNLSALREQSPRLIKTGGGR
ncbi:MAG: hypothetical protein KDI88_00445 [Gammaproteobacteria bacterium]|nr:hypothetical protein [Gammaproteobacteria bacterium]